MEEGDGLPASICLSCNHLLDVSYDFRCQIQNSDVRLRQMLKLQIQSALHEKDTKDGIMIKDIADAVCDVVSCKKDNHAIEQDLYSSHDIVTFDSTAVQSDVVINDESHVSHKFMQKTEEIIESSRKDVPYDALKENVRNAEIMEVTFHEAHVDDAAADRSDRSSSSTTEDNRCIKQERSMLPEDNETSGSLTDENRDDTLKIEVKNDVLLEDLDDQDVSKEILRLDNRDTKGKVNCSDDEEKPLISRTTIRQKCLHCIKSFATKVALQRHMNVHKHKTKLRYVCVVCDKQFSNIDKLKSHMLTCHETRMTDGKASQDDKRANKVPTKVTRSGNVVDESTREEKKNFKFTCKVCSKQFIYQKSFLSHSKSHAEYNVDTSNDVLDQSANKTTGEQKSDKMPIFGENESEEEEEEDDDDSDLPIESLQCTQCGKLFATKRNLKRHISTHSGLKFNCSTCGKGFSRIDKLKDHEQSKHKEEIFGNTDDEDDDEEDNESKINENSENRKKASLLCMNSTCCISKYIN